MRNDPFWFGPEKLSGLKTPPQSFYGSQVVKWDIRYPSKHAGVAAMEMGKQTGPDI